MTPVSEVSRFEQGGTAVRHFKHPATIIATVALLVALTGTAGAAIRAMINGSQIKNGTISQSKLSKSAITGIAGLQSVIDGESTSIGKQGPAKHHGTIVTNYCAQNQTSTPTWCSPPSTVTFGKKTAVLVTGALDLASNNGSEVRAFLGVCYAPHGSSGLTFVQYIEPDFSAGSDSYFAQNTNAVVKGLAPGSYDVGMCLDKETSNANNGFYNVSTATFQTK
jgi:hypothetical protein